MSTFTGITKGDGAFLTTSYATAYTVPAATQAWNTKIVYQNTDTVDHTVSIEINTAAAGDVQLCAPTVLAGATINTLFCPGVLIVGPGDEIPIILPTGSVIKHKADVNSKITWRLDAMEDA